MANYPIKEKEFTSEVMENPDVIKSFKKYKTAYEQDYDMNIADKPVY